MKPLASNIWIYFSHFIHYRCIRWFITYLNGLRELVAPSGGPPASTWRHCTNSYWSLRRSMDCGLGNILEQRHISRDWGRPLEFSLSRTLDLYRCEKNNVCNFSYPRYYDLMKILYCIMFIGERNFNVSHILLWN